MNIQRHEESIDETLMDLLLLADPNRKMVLGYLENSTILVAHDSGQKIGVAVLVQDAGEHELKNIAVSPAYQGRGVAKSLIEEIKNCAKESGAQSLIVGTGNSSLDQLALYQKCGFRMHTIHSDFFKDYPEPIYENGIRCLDLVILKATF